MGRRKVYVTVNAEHKPDGSCCPKTIKIADEAEYDRQSSSGMACSLYGLRSWRQIYHQDRTQRDPSFRRAEWTLVCRGKV